jgi:hypothetical protein
VTRTRWLAAGAVFGLGVLVSGHGYLNGDAAVYAAQGWQGDVWSRPTHAGWAAICTLLAPVAGTSLPQALDLLVAVCAAGLVAMGARTVNGGLIAAGFVLPWCGFAEVDLPWMVLVVVAAYVPGWAASACLLALAVAVSPVALLAAPWVVVQRRDPRVLVGPVVAVAGLLGVSQGEWWTGHRGIAQAPRLPGRTLLAWAWSGVAVVALTKDRRLLAFAPLLLAPPDVPGWVLVGVVAAREGSFAPWARGIGLAALLTGLWRLEDRRATVAREDAVLRSVGLQPGQGIEAPWSWGARLSVIHTRTAYGLPWVATQPVRPLPEGLVEVGLLPPGRRRDGVLRVDEHGVAWVAPWWPSADEGVVQPAQP